MMENKCRGDMYITEPPSSMRHPVGRWYCAECRCPATLCEDKALHLWQVRWEERGKTEESQ